MQCLSFLLVLDLGWSQIEQVVEPVADVKQEESYWEDDKGCAVHVLLIASHQLLVGLDGLGPAKTDPECSETGSASTSGRARPLISAPVASPIATIVPQSCKSVRNVGLAYVTKASSAFSESKHEKDRK